MRCGSREASAERQVELLNRVAKECEKVAVVVLDAVNLETFERVFPRVMGDSVVRLAYSEGLDTKTWLFRTFVLNPQRELFRDFVYISANAFAEMYYDLLSGIFKRVHALSRRFWSYELGTVEPQYVTLAAKICVAKGEARLIVHYLQPHAPFIIGNEYFRSLRREREGLCPEYILARRSSEYRELFRILHERNLAYVLLHIRDKLIPFLRERGYEIYLTADHGEELGVYLGVKILKRLAERIANKLGARGRGPRSASGETQRCGDFGRFRKVWDIALDRTKWLLGIHMYVGHGVEFETTHYVPWAKIS